MIEIKERYYTEKELTEELIEAQEDSYNSGFIGGLVFGYATVIIFWIGIHVINFIASALINWR